MRIGASRSRGEILNLTAAVVGETFGCDRVLVYYPHGGELLHADWRRGAEDHEPLEALLEIRKTLAAGSTAPSLFINDVRRSALSQPLMQHLLAARVRSLGIVPLSSERANRGWIACHFSERYYRWRREDTLMLESLSDYCSLFLDRCAEPASTPAGGTAAADAELRYRRLAEYGNLLIVHTDAHLRVTDIVGNTEALLGVRGETLLNQARVWSTFIHPADYRRFSLKVMRLRSMRMQINDEVRVVNQKTGQTHWLLLKGVPLLSAEGDFLGWEGFGLDITGKRRAEEELVSERRRIEALYEVSRALKVLNDPVHVAHDGLKALLGATQSQAGYVCRYDRAAGALEIAAHEGLRAEFVARAADLHVQKGPVGTVLEKREGKLVRDLQEEPLLVPESVKSAGLRSALFVPILCEREVMGLLALFATRAGRFGAADLDLAAAACTQIGLALRQAETYINEKRQADSLGALYALSHEVSRYLTPRDVAEHALPILQEELACKRMWVGVLNDQGTHIVGQAGFGPGVRGRLISVQIELDLRHDFFDEAIRTKQPVVVSEGAPMECSGLNRVMQKLQVGAFVIVPLVSIGRVVGVLAAEPSLPSAFFAQRKLPLLVSMVNEIATVVMARRFEGKMAEANKMRMASLLASGVAHNFNNLLQAVMGQASMIEMKLPKGSELSAHAKMILSAAGKGAALIRQLLNFTTQGVFKPRALSINDLLQESRDVYRSVLGPEIAIEMKLAPNTPEVLADYSQLQQAITNLLLNAKEAIGNKRGGTVKFTTTLVQLRSGDIDPDLAPGAYLRLDVEDNGVGMDHEKQTRCFEPFYTTKNVDSGTGLGFGGVGLGLSSAYAIVKNHHGLVTVSSEPGEGATFSIYIPAREHEGLLAGSFNGASGRAPTLASEIVVEKAPPAGAPKAQTAADAKNAAGSDPRGSTTGE